MTRFFEVIDNSDYLPGNIYSAGLNEYQLYPQLRTDYINRKRWKFQPRKEDDDGTAFQKFLALQDNPDVLMPRLPDTPFGNLRSFIGT